jgi:thymidine kinase
MSDVTMFNNNTGYLEVVLGPMFSGKTSHIINMYRQYSFCSSNVLVINHEDDKRYGGSMKLSNHNEEKINCLACSNISDIIKKHEEALDSAFHVILINEGQFFNDLYKSVDWLVNVKRHHVYVCGLDGDFQLNKFGQMLDLIPICDKVIKLTSLCARCKNGTKAIFTHRVTNECAQKVIGVHNYEPLCRACYFKAS